MPSAEKRMSKVCNLNGFKRVNTYEKYESRLFDSISKIGDKNRGERQNLVAALDFYFSKRGMTGGLIFLTDDKKATNGILSESLVSFPIWKVWSSLDVVIFLFLQNKHFTVDMARSAIKNINAILASGSSKLTKEEKTQERIRVFEEYNKRLSRVQKVLIAN